MRDSQVTTTLWTFYQRHVLNNLVYLVFLLHPKNSPFLDYHSLLILLILHTCDKTPIDNWYFLHPSPPPLLDLIRFFFNNVFSYVYLEHNFTFLSIRTTTPFENDHNLWLGYYTMVRSSRHALEEMCLMTSPIKMAPLQLSDFTWNVLVN